MPYPKHPYDIPLQFREYCEEDTIFTDTMVLAFLIMALYYRVNK